LAHEQHEGRGDGMRPVRPWLAALGLALLVGSLYSIWRHDPPPEPPRPALPQPLETDPASPPRALPTPEPVPPAPVVHPPVPLEAAPGPGKEKASPGETISRALVREVLEETFESQLPDRRLTREQYEALTDAVLRIRAARRSLAQLSLTPENAQAANRLREELTYALTDFQEVAGLTTVEFTELVQPGLGLDHDTGEDEDVVFETLPEPPPPE
jgi:hypothetical protein